MGKNKDEKDEEIFEEIDDVEEIEDIEEVEDVKDENLADELTDKEAIEEFASGDGKKAKKAKKKLTKGKIAMIVIACVLVVALAGVAVWFFFFQEDQIVSGDFKQLLYVNGYQQYISSSNVSALAMREDATEDHIVSVNEMLTAEGLSVAGANATQRKQIAEYIYNLAVTNYANINGKGWFCYTDSTVSATEVKASLGPIKATFPEFNVGIRAAYGLAEEGDDYMSQTISGVSKLDIDGITPAITDILKKNFGYNIQQMKYDGTFAFRRGSNGGASFYGADSDMGWKYLMGSYNSSFPTKEATQGSSISSDADTRTKEGAFYIHDFDPAMDEVAQKLDYITTPEDETATRAHAWSSLNADYDYAYKISLYGHDYNYYCGDFGTGWAVYDFNADYLDNATTVEYNPDTHVYTIKMVVKAENQDDACVFAKGSLTKDTKDYIQLQNPSYNLEVNTIEVFDNGLIKSWDRKETVSSEEKAKLIVLTGTCGGGGSTSNHTHMAFSYKQVDYDPLSIAARYWPELGDTAKVGSYKLNLSSYPSLSKYSPVKNEIY